MVLLMQVLLLVLIYIPDSTIPKRISEGQLESDQESNDKDSNSNSNTLTPSSSFSTAIVALLGSSKTSETPNFTRTTSKSSVTKTTPTTAAKSIAKAPSTPSFLDSNSTEASKPLFPTSVLSLLGYSDQANERMTENTQTRKGISASNSTSLLNFFQSNSKATQEKESPSDKSDSSNTKFEETLVGVCDLDGLNEQGSSRQKDKKSADKKLPFTMVIHVNGARREYSQQAMEAAQDIVSLQAPLYPTVSLISENTRVWCRYYYHLYFYHS